MKPDRYTKGILTIIAICLVLITFKEYFSFPNVYAGDPDSPALSDMMKYGLVPVNEDGSISVRLNAMDELEVNIVGINTTDELEVEVVDFDSNGPLDLNIERIGNSSISSGGAIPVKIK